MVGGVGKFPFADKTVFGGELKEEDERTEEMEDVERSDDASAMKDVRIGVVRCFACPSHSLTEERRPRGKGTNDGGIGLSVDGGNDISATFGGFKEEHIISGRDFRV